MRRGIFLRNGKNQWPIEVSMRLGSLSEYSSTIAAKPCREVTFSIWPNGFTAAHNKTLYIGGGSVNRRYHLEGLNMHVSTLIEKKRDGQKMSAEEIKSLIKDFTRGEIPDYQMSAWAMAVFFRGMTAMETQHLTDAMMRSGRVLKYPKKSPPKIDKHS